jgi:PAS domain S-box-containing protein
MPAVVYVDASDELSSALYMSPRVEAMLGYAPEEWLDDPGLWVKLLHPEDRGRVLAEQGRTRQTGEPFSAEYRLLARDGRAVWVRDEAVLVEEDRRPPVWYGVLVDITVQKEAETALRESEERYRLAFERAPVSMAHVSLDDGRFLRANDRFCEESGYGREELSGLTWQDITPHEELGACLERVGWALGRGLRWYSAERRYVRKDGRRVWVRLSVSLTRELPGEPGYFACMAEDITGRKLKELVPDPLTDREREVLRLMAVGHTNPQLARCLCYSLGGVKHQVQRIVQYLLMRFLAGARPKLTL